MARLALLGVVTLAACGHSHPDTAWFPPEVPPEDAPEVSATTRYLEMRDGVRIAADVYVPVTASADAPVPAILHQTRYLRSLRVRSIPSLFVGPAIDHTPMHAAVRQRFLAAGYAWVDIDVRGSGASFGTQVCPYSPDEIRDPSHLVLPVMSHPSDAGR